MPPARRRRPPAPLPARAEADASLLSRLFFHWIHPLIRRGAATPLQQSDLPPLITPDQAASCGPTFHNTYRAVAAADNARASAHPAPPSPPGLPGFATAVPPSLASKTFRALAPVAARPFLAAAAWKPVWLGAAIGQAFAIRALVGRVTLANLASKGAQEAPHSRWVYLPVVLALAVAAQVMSVASHATFSGSMRAGMRARAALSAEIYRKMLRLSPAALSGTSEGELGNLLLNDTQRVLDSFTYFHFCWIGFIEIAVISALLSVDLGVSALFGVAVLILLVPAQFFFSSLVSHARTKISTAADVRVQKMSEILSGIRTVKLSAWEPHFMRVVTNLRALEVKHLRLAAVVRALNAALFFAAPVVVALATFTAYTLVFRNKLTPAVVFSSMAYFSTLSIVLSLMPLGWLAASEAGVASRRLDAFFDLPELPSVPKEDRLDIAQISPDELESSEGSSDSENDSEVDPMETLDGSELDAPRLSTRHAQFSYPQLDQREACDLATVLTDVSISVCDGELLSIVGPVGSGKSSLLLGILGEILCTSGEVHKKGRIAYCAQEPWIVNGTLRENITMFGGAEDLDLDWYRSVVDACCLGTDLQMLPAGDLTEIGERGINLSGGQKARVALARAVFSKADLYLLDDPLSAVDAAVSARLIRRVFGRNGLLAGRAQVIVTHQLNLLPMSSKVVVLGGGTVDHCGTFTDLRAQGVEFTGFSGLEDDLDKERSDAARESEEFEDKSDLASSEESRLEQILKKANVDVGISEINKSHDELDGKLKSKEATADLDENLEDKEEYKHVVSEAAYNIESQVVGSESTEGRGVLVAEEDRHVGRVTSRVYKDYIKAGGGYLAVLAVTAAFGLAQTVRQFAELQLATWSNLAAKHQNAEPDVIFRDNRRESLVFFGLAAGTALLTLVRASFFAERTMCASKRLHDRLLNRVLHAKTSFFDTNPIGRILNRFSKDVDQMDLMLPIAAQDFLQIFFVALGAFITISYILPWFIIPLIPIFGGFVVLQQMYTKCSRELKRIDGISRSPIYAQFVETTVGLSTVRAYKAEDRFSVHFNGRVDGNHCAYHMFACSGRWLGIRLDALSGVVVFCTSLVVLLSSGLNPGHAGVALTQSVLITGVFQWGVRQAAETENLFTSVERVSNMATDTPIEKAYEIPEKRPPPSWPSEGRVSFNDVTLKYRPELDPALQNLHFKSSAHERIGIVGRTGSGKSSLFVSLFRMVELTEGSIFIDGIDISEIGLHDLRSRMAIVPQDPVLFNGTIRSNLDPTGSYNDVQLWDALHRVHMRQAIEGISGGMDGEGYGLDLVVHEKGSNFSAGERQLLSLARAILSGVKIVVLDEASASLDNHTDMLVQKTVREQLSDRTVLTIAHRLATIADSDRVLVMDAGEVVEFDAPSKLIESGGYFANLVEETGRIESAILKAIIAEASSSSKGK